MSETTSASNAHLILPDSPLARSILDLVNGAVPRAIANHSIRSYLFSRMVADHRALVPGQDYDADLLFYATVLHDIGLTDEAARRDQRFELDGADVAAAFLTDHGIPSEDIDVVWEAIALHSSAGIAQRRGIICSLTEAGIGLDFGIGSDFVTDADAAAIHTAFPRYAAASSLVDMIVRQAVVNPAKAPSTSLADYFLRTVHGHTGPLTPSRWGD
ncbi:HD domain-containing protein [Streptomyces lunaelactis]|uniref:HD domain-containing protein n=1 Tax=Streptomyces lunaelactis TaxID=1535768 RepID=UPI001585A29E|nr:HD domain-containing protein [Streptomyces lunaelactis]NUK32668.1 HD domain-containing protein [Streptomyces lunaelactis]NUK40900.1 HD domain-containing protein [Streptomyces lunaelactis]NUK91373.1 HD domain-containing protein [Streptomyces lunaelactis]NUL30124.1 HD domain-containing protein [Streptomyces lunaelactis]